MRKILLSLSDDDMARIGRRAARDGTNKSEAVRSLIDDGLNAPSFAGLPSIEELDSAIARIDALLAGDAGSNG